jgi:hypothetical protein
VGCLREVNQVSAATAACSPPIGAKAQGTLRGILHGSKKASPNAWGDVKPDMKLPAKVVSDTLTGATGGRGRDSNMGGGGDLKLEGLDDAQIDELGGVTDEILAAQMEILAENEVLDSGEDTVGEDSEDEESFYGRVNHNPVAPEFKAGARVVYLGQEGDEIHLGCDVAVHGDGKGGPPFYTAYLEGLGEKQVEVQQLFLVAAQEEQDPPVSVPVPSHYSSVVSQAKKDKKEKKEYLKQMSELAKIIQQQRLENKKLEKLFSDSKRQALQLSVALSQQKYSPPADPWDTFVASEVNGSYYAIAQGKGFGSFGIYADVNKFLFEVNGLVGSLFKVCESYSEARL